MIIVQNLDKNILGSFTTLKAFLRAYKNKGASIASYDYIRAKLYDSEGAPVKYKKFLEAAISKRGRPFAPNTISAWP